MRSEIGPKLDVSNWDIASMIGIGLSLSKQIKLSAPAVTRGYNMHAFYNIKLQSKSNICYF